jgi:hypothetical protein
MPYGMISIMKRVFLTLFSLLPFTRMQAEPVELVDTQGRSIQATILSADAQVVSVQMANGMTYRIPYETLSPKSLKTVQKWKALTISEHREPFEISLKKFKQNETKSSTVGQIEKNFDSGYTVTVTNNTAMPTPKLRVEYLIVKEHEAMARSSDYDEVEQKKGTAEIKPLQFRQEAEFNTVTFPIREHRLKGGYRWVGGGDKTAIDDLGGIWIRMYFGDELVFEYAKPSSIPEHFAWDAKSR